MSYIRHVRDDDLFAHPLLEEIVLAQREMAQLEARKRRDRDSEMRLSIYLNGLTQAARLCGFMGFESEE